MQLAKPRAAEAPTNHPFRGGAASSHEYREADLSLGTAQRPARPPSAPNRISYPFAYRTPTVDQSDRIRVVLLGPFVRVATHKNRMFT